MQCSDRYDCLCSATYEDQLRIEGYEKRLSHVFILLVQQPRVPTLFRGQLDTCPGLAGFYQARRTCISGVKFGLGRDVQHTRHRSIGLETDRKVKHPDDSSRSLYDVYRVPEPFVGLDGSSSPQIQVPLPGFFLFGHGLLVDIDSGPIHEFAACISRAWPCK